MCEGYVDMYDMTVAYMDDHQEVSGKYWDTMPYTFDSNSSNVDNTYRDIILP